MEGSYRGGQSWTICFLGKEGIKPSDIHHQECAVCGEKAPLCSNMLSEVRRSFHSGRETAHMLSMSGVAAPLNSGSVNVTGSSQTHCSDV
jgi:hypothetical protein